MFYVLSISCLCCLLCMLCAVRSLLLLCLLLRVGLRYVLYQAHLLVHRSEWCICFLMCYFLLSDSLIDGTLDFPLCLSSHPVYVFVLLVMLSVVLLSMRFCIMSVVDVILVLLFVIF